MRHQATVPMPDVWHCAIGIVCVYTLFNTVTGQCDVNTRPLTLNVTSSPQYVSSPGYPNNYPSDSDCAWLLTAVNSTARIIMNIEDYDSEGTAPCKYDYIAVHDGGDDTAVELAKLCATNAKDINGLTSSGRTLYVRFVSDDSLEYRGFNVLYFANEKSVQPDCGSTLTATLTPQVLMSSNLPSRYTNDYNCFYSFVREHYFYWTRIRFYFMDLEADKASSSNCTNKDHVEISEGASTSSLTPLELWCYSSVTYMFSDINTTAEFLYLNFTTNSDNNQYLGFMLTYEEVFTSFGTTTTTTPPSATSAPGGSSSGGSSSDTIPIVVGVLVGVLFVAAIVAVTIYCINKKKKRQDIASGDIGKQTHPDGVVSNGHTPGMTVEEMDNPALTAN